MIQIGPVTAEILLPKSLYGGWVVVVVVVCKPILVFSLSLGQAEQYRKKEVKVKMFMEKGFHNVVKPILDNSLQKEAWDILVEPDSLPPKKSSNTHKKFPKNMHFMFGICQKSNSYEMM